MPQDKNQETKQDSFESRFENERKEWREKIETWSSLFSNIEKIPELQVSLFSAQGQLADYKGRLSTFYNKSNNLFRDKRGNTIQTFSDSPVRHTAPEKAALLEKALKDDLLKLELVNGHIEFISDIYDIIKNMIYSIKYRVEISNKLDI